MSDTKSAEFLTRLDSGNPVLHAGGYLFEMERRGYLQAGAYVPEVVLEYPSAIAELHREFARAGADIMLAFTYYGHREKLRLIGKEDLLEPLNRRAVQIAREVAADFPHMYVAGNICNTNVYSPGSADAEAQVRGIFTEQLSWAVEEGIDVIVCETVAYLGEALIAVEVAKAFNKPLILGLAVHRAGTLRDFDGSIGDACKTIRDAGCDVVGVNCHRGPATTMPLLEEIAKGVEPSRICGFPVAYRTTPDQPTFGSLRDPHMPDGVPGGIPFPVALDPFVCTRYEMAEFARRCQDLGIGYVGGCCGTGPHHIRAMAEALGRTTPASVYSPDMSKHYALGSNDALKSHNQEYAKSLVAGETGEL